MLFCPVVEAVGVPGAVFDVAAVVVVVVVAATGAAAVVRSPEIGTCVAMRGYSQARRAAKAK